VRSPKLGKQTIRQDQEAADAMVAAWGPSFAADQDEGTERGSGRGISPLVSEIQAATTNAGTRAQGGLTPDFLALSKYNGPLFIADKKNRDAAWEEQVQTEAPGSIRSLVQAGATAPSPRAQARAPVRPAPPAGA